MDTKQRTCSGYLPFHSCVGKSITEAAATPFADYVQVIERRAVELLHTCQASRHRDRIRGEGAPRWDQCSGSAVGSEHGHHIGSACDSSNRKTAADDFG